MRRLISDIAEHKLCTERTVVSLCDRFARAGGLYSCVDCGRYPYQLCDTCRGTLRYATPMCSVCEKFSPSGELHSSCAVFTRTYHYTQALFEYTKAVKRIFRTYKYQEAFQYQRILEQLTYSYCRLNPFRLFSGLMEAGIRHLVVFPVPMSSWKQEERGFSPAREFGVILGRIVHEMYGVRVSLCEGLLRKRDTKSHQAGKTRHQRLLELQQAFSVNTERVDEFCNTSFDAMFVVDDILTTGATTNALLDTLWMNSDVAGKLRSISCRRVVFARA